MGVQGVLGLRQDQGAQEGTRESALTGFDGSGMEDDGRKCKDRQVVSLYVLNLYVANRGRNKTGDESWEAAGCVGRSRGRGVRTTE